MSPTDIVKDDWVCMFAAESVRGYDDEDDDEDEDEDDSDDIYLYTG